MLHDLPTEGLDDASQPSAARERGDRTASAPPLVVLAGSDPRPARLTEAGERHRPLSGHKSAYLEIGGQPLVRLILERLIASKRFSTLYVAGPDPVYADRLLPGVRLVHCDGRLEANLRAAFEAVREDHSHGPIAFLASDVLPKVETLQAVMGRYAAAAPCDVFIPLVEVPEDAAALGASAWKPRYRMRRDEHSAPLTVLPGHLVVVDPDALRIGLVYRLISLSYRTRNRPIGERHYAMLRGLLGHALREDFRQLLTLRLPEVTAAIVADGAAVAMGLKSGNMTCERLARAVRRVAVSYGHRRRYPRRRVELPILPGGLSLARDIDTEEEAREIGAEWPRRAPPAPAATRGQPGSGRERGGRLEPATAPSSGPPPAPSSARGPGHGPAGRGPQGPIRGPDDFSRPST